MTQTRGFRTANRRYKVLFWPMMAIYVAIILGAKFLIDEDTAPAWLHPFSERRMRRMFFI